MFSGLGYTEMALFGIIALMLFGSKLPDVARNFGRTYKELRKKIDEFQREFRDWDKDDTRSSSSSLPKFTPDDDVARSEPSAPKFTPPPPSDDD
ncbi:MAG: twin-arginine translocase TatA/TatE family subunit [Pirellulaceae bacterium]